MLTLLTAPHRQVYCLVRASNLTQAQLRLRRSLQGYGLWSESLAARIHPVLGTLSAERLEMSSEAFEQLAERVEVIYHNGALVDHVRGYEALKPANVEGTHEVLRLASRRRLKPVHFISSLGAVHHPLYAGAGVIAETDLAGPLLDLPNWYMQSKCVAESMLRKAMARGIPASIYRLGAITGHSVTGICSPDDYTYSAVRSCVQLGIADDLNSNLSLTPVDFAVRALIALSARADLLGKVFHVVNPQQSFWAQMQAALCARGSPITTRPYADCIARLREAARRGENVPMLAFMPFLTQKRSGSSRYVLEEDHAEVIYDCRNLLEGLAGSGVELPPDKEQLIDVYLTYLARHGLLAPLPRK